MVAISHRVCSRPSFPDGGGTLASSSFHSFLWLLAATIVSWQILDWRKGPHLFFQVPCLPSVYCEKIRLFDQVIPPSNSNTNKNNS